MKVALDREVHRSHISDPYVADRAHNMLVYFAQNPHFCVHKQTN